MRSLCHLGDLIDALYSRGIVQLLILTHCGDAHGGIRRGVVEEILCRFLGDHQYQRLDL